MSRISFARWAVADVLTTAISIAGRASEELEGTDEAVLFDNLRKAITNLRDNSPEIIAIRKAIYTDDT